MSYKFLSTILMLSVIAGSCLEPQAQNPVYFGSGSIASYPPAYKAKTIESNNGFNATAMLSKTLYVDEFESEEARSLMVPGRPIPTNDWWTDIINNTFSGALWSYPAMLSTSESGVRVHRPSYWADHGKEMKSNSWISVGGNKYQAEAAIAADWHDWDVTFRMPQSGGSGEMTVTAVHGSPFTWVEFEDMAAEITLSDNGILFETSDYFTGIKIGEDLYGLYFPKGVRPILDGKKLTFEKLPRWISVGILRNESDLEEFAPYAASIIRDTKVDWKYDPARSRIDTEWVVTAENLRNNERMAPVLQGFLPHAYKYALPGALLSFKDEEGYKTPRGKMKIASSDRGIFSYSYDFSGMLPNFGAPLEESGFNPDILNELIENYARSGSFGADTYWGGKGLTQMAMNMWFAKQTGNTEVYEISRNKLREAFENWLTYTPGENTFFFSYYPRWGALLGFDVSYDSDAFNDHHFHYGYFTYAAALLCMADEDFAEKYGEILTLIAKDYANWDREDRRFPFMRTFDPWNGHSWAGGLGDHGNDNGNGQESTSEAMQSWGGLYLLGVALGNDEMRDAGIWGWATEARATREYWYDVDAPRPANEGGRTAWPGKNDRQGNYDYNEYPYAYNSNITGKGIGWWTWFGGDPLFMHGIQWMPISPALDYLSWDTDFSAWAFDDMMRGANSSFSHDWFEYRANSDDGSVIEPLAFNDWGNVALAYMQRFDPEGAAEIFDRAYQEGLHIAKAISTGHISYFAIHSHLTYGDPDFEIHASIPTAQAFTKNGVTTFFVYNPCDKDMPVSFYTKEGSVLRTVMAPAKKLAGISEDPFPSDIEYELKGGDIIAPGQSALLVYKVVDQYGAEMTDMTVKVSLSEDASAFMNGNSLKVRDSAVTATEFTVTLSGGGLERSFIVKVNEPRHGEDAMIAGIPEIWDRSLSFTPEFIVTDQYGDLSSPADTEWLVKDASGKISAVEFPLGFSKAGRYTLEARSESLQASAAESLFVTPELPVVSLNKTVVASSAENVGTLPPGLNDGDNSTRWGSAHTDDEWVMIDMGEKYFVSKVAINWEAAFGASYLIEIAPDDSPQEIISVNYAGEKKNISVPAEDSWETAAEVSNSSSGRRVTNIGKSGRYIRMRGKTRGTQYGYSIYEMEVSGVSMSSAPDDIIGMEFNLPEVAYRGKPVTLIPEVYTFDGNVRTDVSLEWSADKESRFEGDQFTPLSCGLYTVEGKLSDNVSARSQVFVNDVEVPSYVIFERDEATVVAGDETRLPFVIMNQFMAPYTGDLAAIHVEVTDETDNVSEVAEYKPGDMTFLAGEPGVYKINVEGLGSCKVMALPLEDVNLAFMRPVEVSSANGGNIGAAAVDGNSGTRWESVWESHQFLQIELDGVYLVDRVNIYWEGAYAKKYSVLVSTDEKEWTKAVNVTNSKGGTERLTFPETEAKFVRIECEERALEAYGFSIWEVEVFGKERVSYDSKTEPDFDFVDDFGDDPWNSFIDDEEDEASGVAHPMRSEENIDGWYTLQGLKIAAPSVSGIYIYISNGKARKIIIKK